MARALTVRRALVAAELEEEYLAVLAELAELEAREGRNLWVFQSERDPHLFLEFSESRDSARHRAAAATTGPAERLERRLISLAAYDAEAADLWSEVTLAPGVAKDS